MDAAAGIAYGDVCCIKVENNRSRPFLYMSSGRLLGAFKGCEDGGVSGTERASKRFRIDA